MILVVGATGKLCSRLARGLLQAGSEVCVLVSHRPPLYALAGHEPVSMVHSLAGAGARPMWGDMSNRASLRRALEGAEAVIAITAFAFDRLGARRVEIRCGTDNERSAAVARRAGFTLEGICRHAKRSRDGKLIDLMEFSQIRTDS